MKGIYNKIKNKGEYMQHEINHKIVEINNTDVTFETIYEKEYCPKQYLDDIKSANLLIIPIEGYRDEPSVVFPETTKDFYDFIKKNEADGLKSDIVIADSEFKNLELHSMLINLAPVIVNSIFLPLAINLISSFLYDMIKKFRRKKEESSAKVSVIVEETKTKKSKKITYEGPISEFKDSVEPLVKDLFKED